MIQMSRHGSSSNAASSAMSVNVQGQTSGEVNSGDTKVNVHSHCNHNHGQTEGVPLGLGLGLGRSNLGHGHRTIQAI
jgi:hypothetical protein